MAKSLASHVGHHMRNVHAVVSLAGQKRVADRWREFLSDPSQWWDHRAYKMDARFPDFTHKKMQKALWLNSTSNPGWVKSEVAELGCGAVHQNPFPWNTRLSKHIKDGQHEKALGLFQEMQGRGIIPDTFTFVQVLNACASLQAHEEGRNIHAQIIQSACETDVFVGSSLIDMYSKCGNLEDGRRVFDKMPNRNLVVWNAMIQGCGKCGQAEEALQHFREMQVQGVEPDVVSFMAILHACAELGLLEEGQCFHAQIIRSRWRTDVRVGASLVIMYARCGSTVDAEHVLNSLPIRNVVAWNSMILGYVKCGNGQQALQLFHRMRRVGVDPDAVTFVGTLNACAGAAMLEEGKRVHSLVITMGYESDLCVLNALIDMYSKCGDIGHATEVFNGMGTRNVVSWTSMLGGYAIHGYGKEALRLFEQMCQEGIKLDWVTFIPLLSACSHAGLVEEGIQHFESMWSNHGISPRAEHYACVVDLLGRAGRLEEAEEVINAMSCESNADVWKALLAACRVHGKVDMAERVAGRVLDLDPEDASGYVMLSNIYAAAKKWDDMARVQQLKMERQVSKQPGRTWISVNDQVHSFVADDRRHPLTHEIRAKLEGLSRSMKEAGYVPDLSSVLHDVEDEEKVARVAHHSEKLAIAFGLISTPPGAVLHIFKNLRVCVDCHNATKFIAQIVDREIVVRDASRFHHFKAGLCSCGDYW